MPLSPRARASLPPNLAPLLEQAPEAATKGDTSEDEKVTVILGSTAIEQGSTSTTSSAMSNSSSSSQLNSTPARSQTEAAALAAQAFKAKEAGVNEAVYQLATSLTNQEAARAGFLDLQIDPFEYRTLRAVEEQAKTFFQRCSDYYAITRSRAESGQPRGDSPEDWSRSRRTSVESSSSRQSYHSSRDDRYNARNDDRIGGFGGRHDTDQVTATVLLLAPVVHLHVASSIVGTSKAP
ncbi:hypothetical protein JCM11641_003268 [Rhodosporidiobolus odoratus]